MKKILIALLLLVGLSATAQEKLNTEKNCYILYFSFADDNLKERVEAARSNAKLSIRFEVGGVEGVGPKKLMFNTDASMKLIRRFCLELSGQEPSIERVLRDCKGEEVEKF